MQKIFFLFLFLIGNTFLNKINSQTNSQQGIRTNKSTVFALKNATIVQSPTKTILNGILLIHNGVIENVGENISIPNDAFVIDLKGKTIYPGFIESYSIVEQKEKNKSPQQQQSPSTNAIYWNKKVLSHKNVLEEFSKDENKFNELRKLGFTSALFILQKGNIKGTSALLNLNEETEIPNLVIRENVFMHSTLKVENVEGENYPNSNMGVISLLRQTLYDAIWYKDAKLFSEKNSLKPIEINNSLESLQNVIQKKQPFVIETSNHLEVFRAKKIADEFNLNLILLGSGNEYKRIDAIKNLKTQFILPLNFPKTPNVDTYEKSLDIDVSELLHWEYASENPKIFFQNGIEFSLTSQNSKNDFFKNLKLAIKKGLPENIALSSLTTVPAKMLNVEKILGTVEKGKIANLIVSNGNIFSNGKILSVWVEGKEFEIEKEKNLSVCGIWKLNSNETLLENFFIEIKFKEENFSANISKNDSIQNSIKAKISINNTLSSISFDGDSIDVKGKILLDGTFSQNNFFGTLQLPNGKILFLNGKKISEPKIEFDSSKKEIEISLTSFPITFPMTAFGKDKFPEQVEYIFINDATIWTSSLLGKIENGDIIIHKGKIKEIGKDLSKPKNSFVIEANGKHITSGLIDCHSHSAVSGSVNETGQIITSEVRIGDVIDSEDISIYRELAGGVTTINALHGSANSIGGQNQVIKLRWGFLPDEMKFENAKEGIKFALGENPKHSNWGENNSNHFPQSRMGVNELIRSEFKAAIDYKLSFQNRSEKQFPIRRDLELDAIVEILDGKRLVHCHSYRQDEILAMIRVAEEFNFRIATFQHILEGYKVATEMANHKVGASTFSDWWAYKYEVVDAIPFNGTMMHNEGIVVSFNSDSDEMARRLNTEAAKAVKYGNLSEEEALNFVTINPAKQLQIDNRVGSLEIGKDADFVVWNGNPLSTYSICEQTWIDGKKFFDIEENKILNQKIQEVRSTLIQKILNEKNK